MPPPSLPRCLRGLFWAAPLLYAAAASAAVNAPTGVALSQPSTGSLRVTWTPVANSTPVFLGVGLSTTGTTTTSTETAVSEAATEHTFTELTPNTTYYGVAIAIAQDDENDFDGNLSAPLATLAAEPLPQSATGVTDESATLSWDPNGNPADTAYRLESSTDEVAYTALPQQSTTQFTLTGLSPSTTYYLRIRAVNHDGVQTSTVALPAFRTLASPPSGLALVAVGSASLSYQWTATPGVDAYGIEASSDGFNTAFFDTTTGTTLTLTGLAPNTTYQSHIGSMTGGEASAYAAFNDTVTLPAPPLPLEPDEITNVSARLRWGANGNPDDTQYILSFSTDNLSFTETTVFGTAFTGGGLDAETTYHFKVRALGRTGQESEDVDLPDVTTVRAAPSNVSLTVVGSTTLSFSWDADLTPGTTYLAQVSTTGFVTSVSSATANASASFSGLQANSAYEARVRSIRPGGSVSAYGVAPLAHTSVVAPTPLSTIAITSFSFTARWDGGPNAPNTQYLFEVSPEPTFDSPFQDPVMAQTYTKDNVSAETTLYLRVRAVALDFSLSDEVSLGTVTTLGTPTTRPTPENTTVQAVSSTTVLLEWDPAGNPEPGTEYELWRSTGADFSGVDVSTPSISSATVTGLTPNTTFFFKVRALGGTGEESGFDATVSTATFPALPSPDTLSAENAGEVTVYWLANGNPEDTTYVVSRSSDLAIWTSETVQGTSHVFTGLLNSTTYRFTVYALARDGVPTAEVDLGTAATLGSPPANLQPTSNSSSTFNVAWSAGPGGSKYRVEASSTSFDTAFSSETFNAFASFSGLAPDTTYEFRVRFNPAVGDPSGYSAAVSSATFPALPVAGVAGAAAQTGITVLWSGGGNPAGTTYRVSGSSDGVTSIVLSTTGLAIDFSGLLANTTYTFSVAALSRAGAPTASVALPANVTLAAAPTGLTVTQTSSGSLHMSWSGATGSDISYRVQVSSDNYSTSLTSVTYNATASTGSLLANTTYQFRVQALNRAGVAGSFVLGPSTSTLAAAPLAADPTSRSTFAVTLNWSANGNPSDTKYVIGIATDGVSFAPTSASQGVSKTLTDLPADTTFQFRVQAVGRAGVLSSFVTLPSTSTLLAAPTATAPAVVSVASDSVTVRWAGAGNGSATRYTAQVSNNSFGSVLASSTTPGLLAAFSGLTPDTTYQFRVFSISGVDASTSANLDLGAQATLPATPASPAVLAITTTTLELDWSPGGNPDAGTRYKVTRSTDAGFASSQTTEVTTSTLLAAALAPNTTYFLKVRAAGHSGQDSADLAFSPTATLPAAPSTAAPTALAVDSLTFNWGANGNPAGTVFTVTHSSDGVTYQTLTTTQTFATLTGLFGNTTYYATVQAQGHGGTPSSVVTLPSTPTLAATPTTGVQTGISSTSLSFNWGANGNGGTTIYRAEASSNAFATVSFTTTTAVSASIGGLASNTTYQMRVQSLNLAGAGSPYTDLITTATIAAVPLGAAPTGRSSSTLTLQWGANGNAADTTYLLYVASGTSTSTFTLTATSRVLTGLPADTLFTSSVQARGRDGLLTAMVPLVSTSTLLAAPTAAAGPAVSVGAGSAVLAWASGGNGPGTRYLVEVSSGFGFNLSSNTALLTASFVGLTANTTHQFQVAALSAVDGSTSPVLSLGTQATSPAAPNGTLVLSASTDTIALDWAPAGNPEPGTTYQVVRSTDAAFVSSVAVTATTSTLTAGALTPNTTYFFRVRALGHSGVDSAFDLDIATATAPTLPAALAESGVSASSLTFNWSANGNPPGTVYSVRHSSDDVTFTAFQTTGTARFLSGLLGNTTYFARVRALGHGGAISPEIVLAATPTLAATPVSPLGTGVSTTSAGISWGANGNSGTTVYRAEASSNAFASVFFTTTTALVASINGLQPNTTYELRVQSLNLAGAGSPFTPLVSTATSPTAPVAAAATGRSTSTLTLNWLADGNAADTAYRVYAGSGATTSTTTVSGLSLSFTLLGDTVLVSSVQAVGRDGLLSALVPLPPTSTLLAAPTAAITTFVQVGTGSAVIGWSQGGNGTATRYTLQASSDSFASVLVTSTTGGSSASFGGLTPNTTHQFRVFSISAVDASTSASVVLGSSATLPAVPTGTTVLSIGTDTVSLEWVTGGNPEPGTTFEIQRATEASFTLLSSATSASNSFISSGLTPNTTYFFRVRARGISGTDSAFDPAVSTATLPAPPLALDPTGVSASSIAFQWGANGNAAGTTYRIRHSSDGVTFITFDTTSTVRTLTGLLANTTYEARVLALGYGGTPSAETVLPSTATLAQTPLSAAVTAVGQTTLSFAWNENGNGSGTQYRAEISSNAFGTIQTVLTTSTQAAYTSLLPDTTYELRVQSINRAGVGSSYAVASASATLPMQPVSAAPTNRSTGTITANWTGDTNPLDTTYIVSYSSAGASSSTVLAVALLSKQVTGLTADTTYAFSVRARGKGGTLSAETALPSAATLLADPTTAVISAVGISSVSLGWSSGGNGMLTRYVAEVSSNGFSTTLASSTTFNKSALFGTGGQGTLTPNTTYQYRVHSESGIDASSSPALSFSDRATHPADPAGETVLAVATTTVWIDWTSGANPEAGTRYEVGRATTSLFSSVTLAQVSSSDHLAASLTPNTTYHFRVRVLGHSGTDSGYIVFSPTATIPAAPGALSATGLASSSVTVQWTSSGNAAGTLYVLTVSTSGGTFGTFSTTDTFRLLTGLTANTTYTFSVVAKGHGGTDAGPTALPSVLTPLATPGAAGTTFPQVFPSSITVQWTSGGNSDGTTFLADISTSSFANILNSSSTLATSALFTGLTPNTTHQFRVQARNGGNGSAFLSLGSVATAPQPPVNLHFISVSSVMAIFDWDNGGNPELSTQYQLWRATSADFSAPTITLVATTSGAASGLTPDTFYYFRARAIGHGGLFSDYDLTLSTQTRPLLPGAPPKPVGIALGISSISWTWAAPTPSATSYEAYPASAPSIVLASMTSRAYTWTGLSTNTAYGLAVAGINITGTGPLSPGSTVYTMAAPPASSTATLITQSGARIGWALNTNPAGSTAEVQRSTNGTSFTSVFKGTATAFNDSGLNECTTYFARVRYENGDGVASAFDSSVQFETLGSTAALPRALAAASLSGRRISLTWQPSPTSNLASYRLYSDIGGTSISTTPLALLAGSATSYTTAVLVSSPAYRFELRPVSRCGLESSPGAFAAAAAVDTPTPYSAFIKTPAAGAKLVGNAVTLVAELSRGLPEDVASIAFELKRSTASAWTRVTPSAASNRTNPTTGPPYLLHFNAGALGAGSYDLRAVSFGVDGSTDSNPATITVAIQDPASTDFDLRESVFVDTDGLTKAKHEERVYSGGDNRIQAGGLADGAPLLQVDLPAGAVTSTVTLISMVVDAAAPVGLLPLGFTPIGPRISLTLGSGQTTLGSSATITLSDLPGTGTPLRPRLFTFDTVLARWVQVSTGTWDDDARRFTGVTPHFSLFQIFAESAGPSSAALAAVRAYPVPFKPNGPDPDEGRPYAVGDPATGIIFDGLPADVEVRIYTITGELVAEIKSAASGGTLRWNAKNDAGEDAASGGYLAVISSGGGSTVRKLLILR